MESSKRSFAKRTISSALRIRRRTKNPATLPLVSSLTSSSDSPSSAGLENSALSFREAMPPQQQPPPAAPATPDSLTNAGPHFRSLFSTGHLGETFSPSLSAAVYHSESADQRIMKLPSRTNFSSDLPVVWLILLPAPNRLQDSSSAAAANNASAVSRLTNLALELFNMIFRDLSKLDRYCLALTCKAMMRFAWSDPDFLNVSSELSPEAKSPAGTTLHNVLFPSHLRVSLGKFKPYPLRGTSMYRELLRLMSKGWSGKNLHFCDVCCKFKELGDDMTKVREEWYGDAIESR